MILLTNRLDLLQNNQLLNIWDLNDERFALQAQLQAHRRPIHDLNWNTFEPNLLTTASLDGYIFLWDTRDLKKPAKMKYFKPGGTLTSQTRRNNSIISVTVEKATNDLFNQ
jgi:WD40 repeat protein